MIEVYQLSCGNFSFRFLSEEGRELFSPPLKFSTDFAANAEAKRYRKHFFETHAKVDK